MERCCYNTIIVISGRTLHIYLIIKLTICCGYDTSGAAFSHIDQQPNGILACAAEHGPAWPAAASSYQQATRTTY